MKPRDSLIRAKEFKVEELRRHLGQFERMMADLRTIRDELSRQIEAEEVRSGVRDKNHYAYSTVARAAVDRRDKLDSTLLGLEERRAAAEAMLAETLDFFTALSHAGEDAADAEPPGQTADLVIQRAREQAA